MKYNLIMNMNRVGIGVILFLIVFVAAGCFGEKKAPLPNAYIKSKPAYVLMGSNDQMKVTPTAYNTRGEPEAIPLRGEVRFVSDLNSHVAPQALLSTSPL